MDGLPWLVESAGRLTKSLELEAMLVTRGKEGMSLFEELPSGLHRMDIPTVARNVYDVTGAGDTAIAVFAAALGAGAGLGTSARLANAAAGVAVGKRGTATVTIEEILEHLEEKESETPGTEEAPRRFRSASHQ
jgi:D-beta-D-heptose 7-phosphate kinase/D-beta-D-heptose 1-phosphate adenosyltransferase